MITDIFHSLSIKHSLWLIFFNLHPFYEGSKTLATISKGSKLQQIRMKKIIFYSLQ